MFYEHIPILSPLRLQKKRTEKYEVRKNQILNRVEEMFLCQLESIFSESLFHLKLSMQSTRGFLELQQCESSFSDGEENSLE